MTGSFENLGDDERRLDRLAEADFVGDQDAGGDPVRDGQCRLELERQQGDARPQRRAQRRP